MALTSSFVLFTHPGINNAILLSSSKGYDGCLMFGIKKRFYYSFLGSFSLLFIAFLPFIRNNNETLFLPLIFSSFLFPFLHSTNSYTSYLHGKKEFKRLSIYQIISSLVYTLSISITVLMQLDLLFIVIAYLLSTSMTNLIILINVNKDTKNNETLDNFNKISNKLTFLGILGTLYNQLDKLIVGTFVGLSSLAIYNFSKAITNPLRVFGVIINKVAFPQFSQRNKSDNFIIINKIIPFLYVFILLLIIIIWLIFPLIIQTVFPEYQESVFFVRILCISAALSIPGLLLISLYFAHEELHSIYFKMHIYGYIFSMPILFFGGYWFGIYGIVFAKLSSDLLSTLVNNTIFYWLKNKHGKHKLKAPGGEIS